MSTASLPSNRLARAVARVFDWKVRGIRWIEIIGVMLVALLVFGVYVAKTQAAREGARIAEVEREIADTDRRVRLLRAEAARLEQPARLEALSERLGLEASTTSRQIGEAALPDVASRSTATPVSASAPEAAATTEPAPTAAPDEVLQ